MSEKPRYRVRAGRGFLAIDGGLLTGEEAPNVEALRCVTKLDLPPDRLLRAALGQLDEVVIVGVKSDGSEWFASSVAGGPDALWHLQRAAAKLLAWMDQDVERADDDGGA